MKLWQRYFFSHLLRTFSFFLACLIVIYTVVDLSIHGVRFFSHSQAHLQQIALYYLRALLIHLDLFFSLSYLLACLKVLLDFNANRELVALQMAGLSRKKLLLPFFAFALFLTLVCYGNNEWFSPMARESMATLSSKKKKLKKEKVYHLTLTDGSELVYHGMDAEKKELFDVYWVKSSSDIWHMKYLCFDPLPMTGRFVDHLKRDGNGTLEKKESFLAKSFRKFAWNDELKLQNFVPFESRSLSTLIKQSFASIAEKQTVSSHLHYKLAMPLIPFLILFAISPIAMQYARGRPIFLIIACSLFAYVGLLMLMDGMLILGENQVLPAALAIWGPVTLGFFFAFHSFSRLR